MANSDLHLAIMTDEQLRLLRLLASFKSKYILVGGTAVALQLGHRRSVDFDLFSEHEFNNMNIISKIRSVATIEQVLISSTTELTLIVSGVKWTFYTFPFPIAASIESEFARIPSLLKLGAMKAFALGGRGKWKDYLDLYFLTKQFSLSDIIAETIELFGTAFNEKLFRAQLSYFNDVSYSDEVVFMPGFEVDDETVKAELTRMAIAYGGDLT